MEQQQAKRQQQQIKFEDAAISIEDFIVVSLKGFSWWGFGLWLDRSLMGDPSSAKVWNSSSQSLLWGTVMRFGTHDLVSCI